MFEGRLPAFANTRSVRVAGGPRHHRARRRRRAGDLCPAPAGRGRASRASTTLHKPYHARLAALDRRAVAAVRPDAADRLPFDALVRPRRHRRPAARDDRAKADFVLGDRYGTSCDRIFVDAAEYELRRFGYAVERNKPYAGGFITEHYGHPAAHRHALQIEINRALYMDERTLQRQRGLRRSDAAHLTEVVRALTRRLASDGRRRRARRGRIGRRAKKGGRPVATGGPSLGRKRPRRAYGNELPHRSNGMCTAQNQAMAVKRLHRRASLTQRGSRLECGVYRRRGGSDVRLARQPRRPRRVAVRRGGAAARRSHRRRRRSGACMTAVDFEDFVAELATAGGRGDPAVLPHRLQRPRQGSGGRLRSGHGGRPGRRDRRCGTGS